MKLHKQHMRAYGSTVIWCSALSEYFCMLVPKSRSGVSWSITSASRISAMCRKRSPPVFVSFYWGSAMVGRFIGSALLQKLRSGTVLGAAAVASFILVITSVLSTGHFAMWSIILVGLFNSVMFPNIFTLGIACLGLLTCK